MTKIRVGYGFDVHQLQEGRDFWLGGVKIDYHKGPLGHSDADILIHAVCDALLGAANLGDIGMHFPDSDPAYKDADSKELLKQVMFLLKSRNYQVTNVDATVVLQEPKLRNYISEMQQRMASLLGIGTEDISIKATTSEKMGFVGREEGIAAHAVVLIENLGKS